MTSLSSEDVFAAINHLEQRFPVAAWRSGDIDLWPSYRFRLYANSMNAVFANAPAVSGLQRVQGLLRRGFRAVLRVPLAALRDLRNNDRVQPGTSAVFFTDGVSFVNLGDTWVDRVMDPIIEELKGRGRRSFKLTPLAEAHVPRHVPSRFVQPTLDRIKLLAPRLRAVEIDTPEFGQLVQAAAGLLGPDAPPGPGWLRIEASRLAALAEWFGGVLARSGASHAFVNTYYSLEGLAFTRAARRLGMCAVDLQHGSQGPHHVAYGRWSAMPATGHSTLPQEFWVWGEDEARNIEAWSSGTVHTPRVTGNFWLQRWKDGSDAVVADYLARARALRDSRPGTRQVLACLTWGVPEEENTKLIEAALLCGEGVHWWWRLHPSQAGRRAEFAQLLESRGLDGSQVSLTTDLPLYALMSAADVTVAHSSTVIREALEFGMRSVVTSRYGAEMHGELIERGDAVLAIGITDIANSVRSLAAARREGGCAGSHQGGSLAEVLDATFGRETA